MLHATEHRQRDQLAVHGRRLLQLGIRVRDRVQRLRRAPAVVEILVFSTDATDVVHVQEDEVIERLLAQRLVQPLDMRGRMGGAVGP